MLTLNEISKKAEELYNKFESDYNQKFESELFTDDEIINWSKTRYLYNYNNEFNEWYKRFVNIMC